MACRRAARILVKLMSSIDQEYSNRDLPRRSMTSDTTSNSNGLEALLRCRFGKNETESDGDNEKRQQQ